MDEEQYSYQTGVKRTFHAADYGVFACTLILSAAIGLYYAIKDRKKNTTDEYLFAGRDMNPIPVSMSLIASFVSAIAVLGTPAEVFVHSTMVSYLAVGFIITGLGAGQIFIPTFYKLGVTTVFQYIEMRFSKFLRTIATIMYIIQMLFYMAIVLYVPSLALNAVTGMSLWGSIMAVGLVCIFYTALGGMKAVVWTDTLQMCIIFAGLITLIVEGSKVIGGFSKAWDIADKGGRIKFDEFDPDPRVRHSFWNVMIGGGVRWMSTYGVNQAQVQRAIAVRSVKRARLALWMSMPGMALVFILTTCVGVTMYAFYSTCYPVKYGIVSKADQLVPLYTMDILGDFHGLPGLILSAIFSGSLSTLSSGLNAIAAVILENFMKPFCFPKISALRATLVSKVIVVITGAICLVLAYVVSQIATLVLQLVMTLFGVLAGPLLGLFALGMLCPSANHWGATIGYIISLAFSLWIGLGRIITKVSVAYNPGFSTAGCNWNASSIATTLATTLDTTNLTSLGPTSPLAPVATTSVWDKYEGIHRFYMLSYQWYSVVAVLIVIGVGLLFSYITGATDPKTLNPRLICPFFDVFFPCLPEKIRKPLRFGVRHEEIDDDEEKKHPAFDIVGFNEGKCDGTFKRIEENNSVSGKDNRSFSMGEIAKH